MVDVVSGSHHHLKGGDQLTAGCAVPRHPEESAEEKRATEQTCSLAGRASIRFRLKTRLKKKEGRVFETAGSRYTRTSQQFSLVLKA